MLMYKSIMNYFAYYPRIPDDAVWGFRVSASGYTRFESGLNYPPSNHPQDHHFTWESGRVLAALQVIGIREGAGVIEWVGGRRALRAGDCMVIVPGVWHRYRPDATGGWTEDWFELRGRVIDSLPLDVFKRQPFTHIPRDDPFWRRFEEFHEVCRTRSAGSPDMAAGLARALFASVRAAADTPAGGGARSSDTGFYDAARERLMAGEPVAVVARAIGLSYPHFYRRFKAVAGLSPKEYQAQIRHSRAEVLLLTDRYSIKEIASKLGFHSAAHFSVEFKKRAQKAPAQWRCQPDSTCADAYS